ncbi:MAG: hypothetical protein ACK4ON_05630 [Bacteroidia bacterium]
MQKNYLLLILVFYCSIFSQQLLANTHNHANKKIVSFTENKGQWENQVFFKADIPGGAMFL